MLYHGWQTDDYATWVLLTDAVDIYQRHLYSSLRLPLPEPLSTARRELAALIQRGTSGTPVAEPAEPVQASLSDPFVRMTVMTAANQLGCSATYVRRLCRAGKLTAQKHGRAWAIDPVDIAIRTQRRAS